MKQIILINVCIVFVLLARGQIANRENDLSLDLLKNDIDELRRHMVIVDSRVWDLENENDTDSTMIRAYLSTRLTCGKKMVICCAFLLKRREGAR